MSSNLNAILTAQADAETTLDAKNRGAAADAVAAVAYTGSDKNYLEQLATAAGVSVTYTGSDLNTLEAFEAAVDALSVVP